MIKSIFTRAYRVYRQDDGVLTFEWVLLVTLLTIGIVSGLTAARDAIIDELGDIANAALSLDQSYTVAAFTATTPGEPDCGTAPALGYTDDGFTFTECFRGTLSVQGVTTGCSTP